MAGVYPTASGAWSTRTWNDDSTGAAYGPGTPQAGDTVYANGRSIDIDQDVTVASLRSTAGTTAAAGGTFTTNGNRTVTVDSYAGSSNALAIAAGGVQVGNSFGSTTSSFVYGTRINSGGIQNGNSTGGSAGNAVGTLITGGGTQNGNSTAGSNSGSHGTVINAGAIQNGNSTGSGTNGAYGTDNSGIQHGDATGGSTSGSHGTYMNSRSYFFGGTVTGNTAGAYGVEASAGDNHSVVITTSEVGTYAVNLDAQVERDNTNVPFYDPAGGGGGGSSFRRPRLQVVQ